MRFRYGATVVLSLSLLLSSAQPVPADGDSLSDEERIWGLMQVWAEAKFNFPFFDQVPTLDWDASARGFIPKVVAAPDTENYYEVLMEFAAQLKDGHTAVIPPWRLIRPGWDQPPVEIQVIDGRFFIARVGVSEALRDQKITPGLEVLEVGDGTPIRTYFEETVVRLGSRGTPQADEAVGLISLLYGPEDSTISLKVRDLDGSERHVTLVRRSLQDDGQPFSWRLLEWYEADPSVAMKRLAGGIVYFRLANFGTPEGADQFREIFDGLDLGSTTGIILDIRFNPGGGTLNAYDVVSCFIDEPVEGSMWKSRRYVPAHRSWGMDPEWEESEPAVIQPRQGKRFPGPLVVLTGPATFSSAEDFLVPLRQSGRAVLVGATTAGSTGNPIYVDLPGGGMFRVVSKRDLFPDGTEFVGIGIAPDIAVEPSPRDLHEGRDPVLEAGIEAIADWSSRTAAAEGSKRTGVG
ncbi:MAG: S41 family peptidase [Holophagae bacterium]|jgi:C-terminal processing protease CtpA/Prc